MASSSESFGLQFHGRSISLPSRLHPKSIPFEGELNKLKTLEASATESLNGDNIQGCLVGLAELYNCVQQLLESPSTGQALLQYQNGIAIEEALDNSIEVLDSCSAIKNLFLTIKEQVQVLQSALRRRNNGSRDSSSSSIESDISSYLCFRKKVKKEISKTLRKFKHMETKIGSSIFYLSDVDHNLYLSIVINRVVREVNSITISILRSMLMFLSSPPSRTKGRGMGWPLISKLMLTKSTIPKGGNILISDVGFVDMALTSLLHGNLRNNEAKVVDIQIARKRLEILENRCQVLESGLECLFRQLVRNRVTLLNILTP